MNIEHMESIIGLWPNLDRAIEIAGVGDYSIEVIFNVDDYPAGVDDYKTIKEFYSELTYTIPFVAQDGDLTVEIVCPYDYEQLKHRFQLDDVERKINNAKLSNVFPTEFSHSACNTLLKTAKDKLNLSLKQVEHIKKVAATIARLELSPKIDTVHVAEAIQYNVPPMNELAYCRPEANEIQFGAIKYAKDKLTVDDIDNAINYLTNLKNGLNNNK
jgi:hypothetical protein